MSGFLAFAEWKARRARPNDAPVQDYEHQLALVYRALLKPGDGCIDARANRGVHTLQLSACVGPAGKVHAFEPSPKPAALLIQTLVETGCDNVKLTIASPGASAGQTTFHHDLDNGNYSRRTSRELAVESRFFEFEVALVRLDDAVTRTPPVKFIRLDLEGREFDAIRGASRILKSDRPVVGFENGLANFARRYGYDANEFFQFFESYGYSVYTAFGEVLDASGWDAASSQFHFFAVPNEMPTGVQIVKNAAHTAMAQWAELHNIASTQQIGPKAAYIQNHLAQDVGRILSEEPDWPIICDASFAQLDLINKLPEGNVQVVSQSMHSWINDFPFGKFQVVALEEGEAETVAAIRKRGYKVIGLMSDIALRIKAFAPARFWAGAYQPPERKIAILSCARSGSTVLAREFERLGIGQPTEHVDESLFHFSQDRAVTGFEFETWQKALVLSNTTNGVFATKLIWQMLRRWRTALSDQENGKLDEMLASFDFVVIDRADVVAQAVSNYIALKTTVWHKWKFVSLEEYQKKLDKLPAEIDWMALEKIYADFVDDRAELLSFAEQLSRKVVRLDFQTISNHPPSAAARAALALGFPIDLAQAAQTAPALEPTTSHVHDTLVDGLRRRLMKV